MRHERYLCEERSDKILLPQDPSYTIDYQLNFRRCINTQDKHEDKSETDNLCLPQSLRKTPCFKLMLMGPLALIRKAGVLSFQLC